MIRKRTTKMYEGFSLIEMLITITILGFVMLLCATVLNSLIKVSTIADYKNTTRNDVNFITEFSKRALGNANLENIYLYDTYGVREYNSETGQVVDEDPTAVTAAYSAVGLESGTEIHVRVYGYDRWTCIGYFKDSKNEDKSYILKTSTQSRNNPEDCFGNTISMKLNSEIVTINDFKVSTVELSGGNILFTLDIAAEPMSWPVGENIPVTREITKQVTVRTQGLTWY
jgi:prepilin-type N-terminal cleavage/methylation domain-containing protein